MGTSNRVVIALCFSGFVWCLIAAAWMTTLPMMTGDRRPTVGEAAAMVSVPACVALAATWAAWHRRRGWLVVLTAVAGLFALVTGFSIGSAFVPTFGLLVWAGIASIDAESDS